MSLETDVPAFLFLGSSYSLLHLALPIKGAQGSLIKEKHQNWISWEGWGEEGDAGRQLEGIEFLVKR